MFSTSYLTVYGLLLEMAGLGLLFIDLLKTKTLSDATAATHAFQEDLNVSTRDLLMNLNAHVALLSDFMSKYAGILAREAEFEEEARAGYPNEAEDSERKELIAFVLDKGPSGLRRSLAQELQKRIKTLPTEEKIAEAIALNLATAEEILKSHQKYQTTAAKLRIVAIAGISLIAVGAGLQFADLLL